MIKDNGRTVSIGRSLVTATAALLAVLALAACDEGATGGGDNPAATESPAPSDTTTSQ